MSGTSGSESIADALRRAAVEHVTSVLRVEIPGDVGYLFIRQGQVVHASTLDLGGEAAATMICDWSSGILTWCERRWPAERSVSAGWSPLPAAVAEPIPAIEGAPVDEPSDETSSELTPVVESSVHFPSAFGIRRVLRHTDFETALRVTSRGEIGDGRGDSEHLKPILSASASLGDSLGKALGLGPLIAAEAKAKGWHLLVARSADDISALETSGGEGLHLARAFLKL